MTKTYFIADNNGTIYAHDINTAAKAESTLADILTAHPEYEGLGLEVLTDGDDSELVSAAIADGSLEATLIEAWEASLRHPSCEYRVMLDLEDGDLWVREALAGDNAITFRERDGKEVCLHTFCFQGFDILDDWAFLDGADEANQYVREVIGKDAYKTLEAKAADENMEPYRLATEDDSIRDRLVDAAIDEYSTECQREVIEGAMDAIESQYN